MTPLLSIPADVSQDRIAGPGRQGVFLLLVSFLAAFVFIRTSARLARSTAWWPGSAVTDSGVHLHHLVWGICLMMASGVMAFAVGDGSPWRELCAVGFGVGMGLTIDEFALWVYLRDVYWTRHGRASIDAALYAATLMGLLVLGIDPLALGDGAWPVILTACATLALSLVCFAKERVTFGLVGLFVPLVSLVGALRLAKPRSLWARRRYGVRNPAKQARAERRFATRRADTWKNRVRDAVGGRTDDARALRATLKAVEEVRHRADRRAADESVAA